MNNQIQKKQVQNAMVSQVSANQFAKVPPYSELGPEMHVRYSITLILDNAYKLKKKDQGS